MTIAGERRISVAEFLIFLIALLYPVNYSLALTLRIADVLTLLLVLVSLPQLRVRDRDVFALSMLFFVFYVASILYGVLAIGIVASNNFIFVYKYLFAFVLFWVLGSFPFSPGKLRVLQRILFLVFFLLIAWVYVYVLLRLSGVISGNFRVSFPFSSSTDPNLSDSPTYSAVLATCLIAYLFTPRPGSMKATLKALAITALTVVAILLSGSRTGLASLALTFFVFSLRSVVRAMASGRIRFRRYAVWITIGVVVLLAFFAASIGGLSNDTLLSLFSRAVSFGMDESVNSRLAKTMYAIQQVFAGPVLLGIGSQSTVHVWFDSAWPNILINTGPVGVLVFLLLLYFMLRHARSRALANGTQRAYRGLEYLFINYAISSISIESFLVTRGFVPFAAFTAIFMNQIYSADSTSPASETLGGGAPARLDTI
jgi:hypothetical protein